MAIISMYPHWDGDKFEKAYEYVDVILLNVSELGSFEIVNVIKNSTIPQLEKDISRVVINEIRIVLKEKLKFIEHVTPGLYALHLTDEGRKAKKAGGYKQYEQLKEQEAKTSSTIVTNTISTNYGNANLSGHDSFLESADNNFPTHPQTTPTTNKAQKGYWLVKMLSNNWTITIVGSIVAAIVTALIIYHFKIPH